MALTLAAASTYTAAASKQTLASNYIDFATLSSSDGWAQQYLPDLMEKESEVFGNRTISGFLEQVGAEESMTADQVVWSEQGRLHLSFVGTVKDQAQQDDNNNADGGTLEIDTTIDGISTGTDDSHGIRINDMLLIATSTSTARVFVTAVNADAISVAPYDATANTGRLQDLGDGTFVNTAAIRVLVYGSEFQKGSNGRTGANKPGFRSYTNKPIILKDKYEISGSDASQVGWVEVSGEDGQSGYMWYLKAAGDTRARFADYLEMAMIESIPGDAAQSTADTLDSTGGGAFLQTNFGTEGLFNAVETRGNITDGLDSPFWATNLGEFDLILAEFDRQGAIEENMMFLNRATSLNIDDMLAGINGGYNGGASFGVFENDADMALNLGFSGFRRGSYDFYKSDWKYLNDFGTRGGLNDFTSDAVRGLIIPAGVSSVYDQVLGKNLKRPFLHVRYRSSQTDDRRMKTWTTGSVGAVTSDLDAMEMHFLSERCLVVQGARNFMMIKG
tara:strand:+ start:4689 stop:6197 length:1509 start_codon:yes stop_codon:yes gene_type:complete